MEKQEQQHVGRGASQWPWNDEDLAPLADDASDWPLPWWHRIRLRVVALCLAGIVLFVVLTVMGWRMVYQHNLDDQAQWIAQQNQAQITCLHHAKTPQAQTACASALANAVTAREVDFAHQDVAPGYANAATEMQSALDALYASACYDPNGQTIDQTCLGHMAPSLRMLAILDAVAARQSS